MSLLPNCFFEVSEVKRWYIKYINLGSANLIFSISLKPQKTIQNCLKSILHSGQYCPRAILKFLREAAISGVSHDNERQNPPENISNCLFAITPRVLAARSPNCFAHLPTSYTLANSKVIKNNQETPK